jgi:hypothetical protein
VEGNGGTQIGDGFLIAVSLAHHNALNPEGLGHIAVLMTFNDQFETLHGRGHGSGWLLRDA